MPNDIQDWTAAVNIQAGTVTIGSGSVSITGIPTVNINTGQSVGISGTPSVLISGTPNVSIAGTPTVILGGGTASVGSISAIGSTVTVAGTVAIGGTPSVTISGTPSVNIASGTVNIGGTPNINISGQSITVNTNQPQSLVLDTDIGPNVTSGSFFTALLPAGTHAVEVYWSAGTVPLSRIDSWSLQGGITSNYYRNFTAAPDTLPYPIRVSGLIESSGLKVNVHFTPGLGAGETVHVKVVAILDTAVPTLTDQSGYAHVDPLQVAGKLTVTETYDGAAPDSGLHQTLFPLANYGATQGVAMQNKTHRGVMFQLHVSVAGTGTLQLQLYTNGLSVAHWFPTAVAAAGYYLYLCYPGAVKPGAGNTSLTDVASLPVGDGVIVNMAKSDASGWTYELLAQLLP